MPDMPMHNCALYSPASEDLDPGGGGCMAGTLKADVVAGGVDDRLVGLGTIAREMFSRTTLNDTLDTVLGLARQTFSCDSVAILLGTDGGAVAPVAASDSAAESVDALQMDSRQGPGQDAMTRRQPVIATDLRAEGRWRVWAPRAVDLGFQSVLSLSLLDGDTFGALNLYSRSTGCFGPQHLALAQSFAQHAAIATAVASERQQLLQAINSRGLIGQAQGMLMQRHKISAEQAFTVLRRYASHLDRRVQSVAEDVIRGRALPELDPT